MCSKLSKNICTSCVEIRMGLQHGAAERVRAVTEQVFQPSAAAALGSEEHKGITGCETVFSLPGNPEPKVSLCGAKCHTSAPRSAPRPGRRVEQRFVLVRVEPLLQPHVLCRWRSAESRDTCFLCVFVWETLERSWEISVMLPSVKTCLGTELL